MTIKSFKLTRFLDRHDRIMGDNQVLEVYDHHFGRELTTNSSDLGPEIRASLSYPCPLRVEIVRTFEDKAWPGLFGTAPAWIVYRVSALRTGSMRPMSLPFNEVINHACRDLAANQAGLSLRRLQGGTEPTRAITYGRSGHGLTPSETARRERACLELKRPDDFPTAYLRSSHLGAKETVGRVRPRPKHHR
jgi:hypothetical protein